MTQTKENSLFSEVYTRKYGYLSELENKFTPEKIRELELLGYIENGLSPKGETWKITEKGLSQYKAFHTPITIWDRIEGWIYCHILGYNIKL